MFILDMENRWLGGKDDPLVPGHPALRVCVRPIDDDMRDAGEAAYTALLADYPRDERGRLTGSDREVAAHYRQAWKAYGRVMLQQAIVDWEGFFGADKQPLAATPDNVASALRHPDIFDALDTRYVAPFLLRRLEKNG